MTLGPILGLAPGGQILLKKKRLFLSKAPVGPKFKFEVATTPTPIHYYYCFFLEVDRNSLASVLDLGFNFGLQSQSLGLGCLALEN